MKKKWPYFNDLITRIRREYKNNYSILVAPGPNEIEESKQLKANVVLDEGSPINIKKLISLISQAKFVIANDTGPAHIASHLKKKDWFSWQSHVSKKVSIGNSNFKVISVENLQDLKVNMVMKEIKNNLD